MTEGSGSAYTYDANGNVLTTTNDEGTVKRTYDVLKRITSVTDVYGNVAQYEYDETGNITEIIYPDGKSVQYTYDLLGQMETVTDYANRTTSYEYDMNGRLVKTYYPNSVTEEVSYDSIGQVVSRSSRKGNRGHYQ